MMKKIDNVAGFIDMENVKGDKVFFRGERVETIRTPRYVSKGEIYVFLKEMFPDGFHADEAIVVLIEKFKPRQYRRGGVRVPLFKGGALFKEMHEEGIIDRRMTGKKKKSRYFYTWSKERIGKKGVGVIKMEIATLKDLKEALNTLPDEILDRFSFQLDPEGNKYDTLSLLAFDDREEFWKVWEDAREISAEIDNLNLFFEKLMSVQKLIDVYEEIATDYLGENPEPISTETNVKLLEDHFKEALRRHEGLKK